MLLATLLPLYAVARLLALRALEEELVLPVVVTVLAVVALRLLLYLLTAVVP